MLICLGDIHFNDSRPWSVRTGFEFIRWIKTWDRNSSDNVLILLGDITESASLSGIVIEMLMAFFSALRFKKVYIIKGNHDTKLSRSGQQGLTYSFLKKKDIKGFDNIEVIDEITLKNIEGINVLALPHITTESGHSLRDYENITDSRYFNSDLIVGHFADTSLDTVPYELIDIEYLKAKNVCLGHVHSSGKHYPGSVVPNSISEVGKRYAQIYNTQDNKIIEKREELPCLLDYYDVTYPEILPATLAVVPVYTVLNCKDEAVARSIYGQDIYIRKCVYDVSMDTEALATLGADMESKKGLGVKEMFNNWLGLVKITDNIKDLALRYMN